MFNEDEDIGHLDRIKVARYVNEDEDIGHQDQGGKVCQ